MNDSVVHTIVSASRPVRIAATVALSALALFLLIMAFQALSEFGRSDKPITSTITVTGEGKSAAVPNIAQLSFTVQESASTVAAAQDSATKRTNDALAAIKELGIEDKDVQTTGYNVSPQYESRTCPIGVYCTNSNTIIGYQVSQSVNIKVRDTAKAGDVLQKLGTLGVQNISGPNFTLDDDSAVRDEARNEAIADARAKAKVLAKQLGVHLGTVVSFSENGGAYPMYSTSYAKGGVAMDAAVAPSLPTGENETNVIVNITYEIR